MTIDFNAQEIVLRLVPVGKPLGRKPVETRIYTEYAENATVRFVQELCGLVGGLTVYVSSGGVTVPVSGWRDPSCKGVLPNVSTFVVNAMRNDRDVTVFGSDRARWRLTVSCGNRTHDSVDNLTDRASDTQGLDVPETEANGIRTNF